VFPPADDSKTLVDNGRKSLLWESLRKSLTPLGVGSVRKEQTDRRNVPFGEGPSVGT